MNTRCCVAMVVPLVTALSLGTAGVAAAATDAVDARVVLAATSAVPTDLADADLSVTRDLLQARPDFGGMWLADGNRLVVGIAGRLTDATVAAVRAATPSGAPIEVRRVRRSWTQLLDLYRRATDRMDGWDTSGVHASEVAVDVRTNTVEIVVDPSSVLDAPARMAANLGPGTAVIRRSGAASATSDRTSPFPHVRAGQRIVNITGILYCTAGIQFVNTQGQYYLLTAGHCGDRNWYEGSSGGPLIGTTHNNRYAEGTTCDCAAVGPLSAARATNVVYTGPNTGQALTDTVYRTTGQVVCVSGASTATNPVKCSSVDVYPVSFRYDNNGNKLVKNLVRVHGNQLRPGDSGAPVFIENFAVGVAVAADNDGTYWYYSPIQTALQAMSARLLTYTP